MKRFFSIFFIIFVIMVTFSQSVQAKDIEFVQVTDLHFKSNPQSIQNFETMIDLINSMNRIDFVVFTGDNIDKSKKDVFEQFLKIAKKINVPYYVQIGNHDCYKGGGIDKSNAAKLVSKYSSKKIKSFNYVVHNKDFVFVFIDGSKQIIPFSNGYFRNEDLTWLDKILTKYEKKNVIIFQHFPVLDTEKADHNLYKAQEYKDVLAKHKNVKAIFAGHYHRPMEEVVNGVLHVVTPPAKQDFQHFRDVIIKDNGKKGIEIDSTVFNF